MSNNKWQSLSLSEQLANIGSEVMRMLNLRRAGECRAMEESLDRALELLDLTLTDKRWRGRLKEIVRLQEVLSDCCFNYGVFAISDQMLKNYFLLFALLARKAA